MTNAPSYDGYHKYTGSIAATYDADREVEAHWWKEDQFVRDYFSEKPVERLLDLPVGTGRFFPHYKLVGQVVGVDVSDDMLNEARRKLTSLPPGAMGRVERGDVFALRFSDREFTHALVWRLFHLLLGNLLPGAVAELCRVTSREIVVQTYPVTPPANDHVAPPYRRRFASTLRRVARRLLPSRPQQPPPAGAVASNEAKPWSGISSYSHQQDVVDALFRARGFTPQLTRLLDTYDRSDVRVTVYQR
jgi:ubiquinone/menaquinone biosynthesis C-methylase UbiE